MPVSRWILIEDADHSISGVGTSLYLAPETIERRRGNDRGNRYTDKVSSPFKILRLFADSHYRLIFIHLELSYSRCRCVEACSRSSKSDKPCMIGVGQYKQEWNVSILSRNSDVPPSCSLLNGMTQTRNIYVKARLSAGVWHTNRASERAPLISFAVICYLQPFKTNISQTR